MMIKLLLVSDLSEKESSQTDFCIITHHLYSFKICKCCLVRVSVCTVL
jgi:hypothetical protein